MKKNLLLIPIYFLILFNLSCKKSPTEVIDNTQPGRRDYVWTVDTLIADDWFGINEVWGSSPNDIWIVAGGVSSKDCLWHYNGIKWTKSAQRLSPGLSSIFGFTTDDIWAGDTFKTIWKYDGSKWYKFQELSMVGYDRIVVEDIYGITQESLFAVGFVDNNNGSGYKGAILKYDGSKWNFLSIPNMQVGFNYIRNTNDGNYLITATNYDSGFLYKTYIYDGDKTLKEIYSDYNWPSMFKLNGELFVSINKKIYKYRNRGLELWKDFLGVEYHGTVLGKNVKDFFVQGLTE